MITRALFDRMKVQWGLHASWAVWAEPSDGLKSNVGELSIFDVDENISLLQTLTGGVVMVGLNISRPITEPLRNFHDPSPNANDFKIRYAFSNTIYYGAYMTDFIKDVTIVDSKHLLEELRATPSRLQKNVNTFLAELADLNSARPEILAFGADTHSLLARHIPRDAYSRLVKVTHYSHRIGREQYRARVLRELSSQ